MNNDFLTRYGPWALVTGASSGIGEQFTRLLAESGFNVLITARREHRLQILSRQLQQDYPVTIEALALDLCSDTFLSTLLTAAEGKHIGLIISNAGFGLKGLHHLSDPVAMTNMLSVNARAPMLIAHAFTPRLITRGGGGFIITGSMEGFMGFPYSASYAATKAFVHSLGDALWQELRPHNIDVLVLAPGSTNTEALSLQGIDAEQMTGLMSPRSVASQALNKLGKKRVLITGWLNILFVRLLQLIPRRWSLAATEAGMRSAIGKKQ